MIDVIAIGFKGRNNNMSVGTLYQLTPPAAETSNLLYVLVAGPIVPACVHVAVSNKADHINPLFFPCFKIILLSLEAEKGIIHDATIFMLKLKTDYLPRNFNLLCFQ
jgi:hypothetical protein